MEKASLNFLASMKSKEEQFFYIQWVFIDMLQSGQIIALLHHELINIT